MHAVATCRAFACSVAPDGVGLFCKPLQQLTPEFSGPVASVSARSVLPGCAIAAGCGQDRRMGRCARLAPSTWRSAAAPRGRWRAAANGRAAGGDRVRVQARLVPTGSGTARPTMSANGWPADPVQPRIRRLRFDRDQQPAQGADRSRPANAEKPAPKAGPPASRAGQKARAVAAAMRRPRSGGMTGHRRGRHSVSRRTVT